MFEAPGQGRCAPRGQSLLRSCLAARSFPPRPPARGLFGTSAPEKVPFAPRRSLEDGLLPAEKSLTREKVSPLLRKFSPLMVLALREGASEAKR